MLTENWETLADIARRTGIRAEEVIEAVRLEIKAGRASLRFMEYQGVKITQIQKRGDN
jgi:hypothetical protein